MSTTAYGSSHGELLSTTTSPTRTTEVEEDAPVDSDTIEAPLLPPSDDATERNDDDTTTSREENDRIEEQLAHWHQHTIFDHCQRLACLAAHILAFLSVLLVGWWIHLLGGLSWNHTVDHHSTKLLFNWHPLLMIVSFAFMTVAALSFRTQRCYFVGNYRTMAKMIHLLSWMVAALCGVIALVAVFRSHNDKESGYVSNLYSFHSWMGMGVLGLYGIQFGMGFGSFVGRCSTRLGVSELTKAKMLSIHTWLGPLVYMGMSATIWLGIQEKEGFINCSYPVADKPDTVPIMHLLDIPHVCLVSHGMGMVVLATAFCTAIALHDFRSRRSD